MSATDVVLDINESDKRKSKKVSVQEVELTTRNSPNSSVIDTEDDEVYTVELRRRMTKSNYQETLAGTHSNPATLTWKDILYQMKVKKKTKTILNKVSGCVQPGQLLAIMGSSGAGKTSLLNVLARRASTGTLTGEVKVNGIDIIKNKTYLKLISGYVMQDDVLFANLTVRETLMYSALLRLPASITRKKKMERVEQVIQELGLTKVADSKVGNAIRRGISGGERKRVCIGTELITDPSLLFLDEPTSGLDAFTSYSLMETLLGLAKSGRTVVCTIHQPRSNIFKLFDMLLILAEGQTVYFGPAKDAIAYFSRLNFKCPKYVNPADYFLDIVSIDFRSDQVTTETPTKFLISEYQKSPEEEEQRLIVESESKKVVDVKLPRGGFASGYFTQLGLLLQRSVRNFYRDKLLTAIRLAQAILFSLFVGALYYDINNNQRSITDRAGALFFVLINQSFGGVVSVLASFPDEKVIFQRERAARMYRVSPYFISKSLGELPGQLLFPIIYCAISYWLIGFQNDYYKFGIYTGIIVLTNLAAISMGMVISAAAPNATAANLLAPVFIIIFLMFGGFYINTDSIPIYFLPFEYASFIKYGFIAILRNEFEGLKLKCDLEELIQPGGVCPYQTGEAALNIFSLDDFSILECCYILVGIGFAFRVIGYLILRCSKK